MDLKTKSLGELARLIRNDWSRIYFGALPYLNAMGELQSVQDAYGYDDGTSIVRYFLGNAATWRGPVAKAVKAELKARVRY